MSGGGRGDLSFFAKMKEGAVRAFLVGGLCLAGSAAVAQVVCEDEGCVGDMARACWSDDVTRAGVCLGEEQSHWGQRYDALRQGLVEDEVGIEAVNDASRAFVSYRNVTCTEEDAALRGLLGSGEDWAECMIEITATQFLTLEQVLEERQ